MFRKITLLCVFMGLFFSGGCTKMMLIGHKYYTYDDHYQHEIASTHTSVLTIIPWDEIKDELQPDFEMDSAKAFEEAIPTSFAEDRLVLQALSTYLKAGLAGALSSTTSTSLKGNEIANSFSESQTKTFNQPDIKDLSINHDDAGTISTQKNKELESTCINPRLRYSAATALYQEVKLLNKYVKYASKRDGYTPYLVRMQVSLNPKTHDAPYDAYSTISFFPDRFSNCTCDYFAMKPSLMKTPYVIPLLAAEDLESSSYNRTNEKVLQLGMALMATINGIGAEAGFSSTAKNFLNTASKNYNSLMTVGRASDNSIRVRFGAMLTASESGDKKEYTMIPRTHYVTLLLMVPNTLKNKLMAVTRTTLVNTENGKELMWTEKGTVLMNVALLLNKYEIPIPKEFDSNSTNDQTLVRDFFKMATDVQSNRWDCFDTHYDSFCKSLEKVTEKKENTMLRCKTAKLVKEQIWTDIANLWVGGQYSYTSFQVNSNKKTALLPDPAFIFPAIDDGKTTDVFISGGKGLNKNSIKPLLITTFNKKEVKLPALLTSETSGGTGCTISFQSLKGLERFNTKTVKLNFSSKNQTNMVFYQLKKEPILQKCSFDIHSTMTHIVTEKGQGELQVVFSGVNTGNSTCLMKVKNGAVVDSALTQAGFILSNDFPGWRNVPRNGLATIPLFDLNVGTDVTVTIKAVRGKNTIKRGKITAIPIILTNKKEK